MKPNLFIIGASKCGTTSLWHMLNLHPDIFMSEPKEPWFFSFSDYEKRLDWYHNLFKNVKNEKIIGEASPIYSETTLIPELPERIFRFNPDAKIIYIVREPIDRLKSAWRQTLYSGHWYKEAYKNYTDVKVNPMSKKFKKAVFSYPAFLEATKYHTHLNNYRKYFSDDKILLLFFEDLKTDPKGLYKIICSFLQVPYVFKEQIFEKKNSSNQKKMVRKWVLQLKKYKEIQSIYSWIKEKTGFKANIGTKSIKYEIRVSKKIEKKIYDYLQSEIEGILSYGNKTVNFWKHK